MKRIVPIIMGSASDENFARRIGTKLDEFGIPHKYHVASAHKHPEYLLGIVKEYDGNNFPVVYETVAGRSNGLSGTVAGHSINPVIACPPDDDKAALQMDIWSSLRMPSDCPVMTVMGPENAALAAIRMLAMYDEGLREMLKTYGKDIRQKIEQADHNRYPKNNHR